MFPHRIEPHRTLKRLLFLLALLQSIARADAQRPRLAVGGFFAESNAFYPAASEMTAAPEPASREAWLQANAVGGSPTAGLIEAGAKLGLDLYPVVSAGASFLGAVSTTSFNKHLDELIRQLKTADPKFDGIFLVLHGAMVVDKPLPDPIPVKIQFPIGSFLSVIYDRERQREKEILMATFREIDVLKGKLASPDGLFRTRINQATGENPTPKPR